MTAVHVCSHNLTAQSGARYGTHLRVDRCREPITAQLAATPFGGLRSSRCYSRMLFAPIRTCDARTDTGGYFSNYPLQLYTMVRYKRSSVNSTYANRSKRRKREPTTLTSQDLYQQTYDHQTCTCCSSITYYFPHQNSFIDINYCKCTIENTLSIFTNIIHSAWLLASSNCRGRWAALLLPILFSSIN